MLHDVYTYDVQSDIAAVAALPLTKFFAADTLKSPLILANFLETPTLIL